MSEAALQSGATRVRWRQRHLVRIMLWGQGVSSVGDGLWFTVWAIYLTRSQGLSNTTMALGIGVGSVIGFSCAIPVGSMADRSGPRELLGLLTVARGVVMLSYIWVHSFWSLALTAALLAAGQSSAVGLRVTLVSRLITEDQRISVLARTRVIQHVAYAVGASIGAVVLGVNQRWLFVATVVLNAVTFFGNALLTMLLPTVGGTRGRDAVSTSAIGNRPFLLLMSATGVLALCWAMLSTGLPLWLRSHSVTPTWTSGAAVVFSSVAIALLQVPVTRRAKAVKSGVRFMAVSGVSLALACVIFAGVSHTHVVVVALLLVLLAMCAHVIGELAYVAGRWGLSLELSDPEAQGQYQGIVASSEAAVVALGPAAVTLLIGQLDGAGWLVLAALFVCAVIPTPRLTRWALTKRGARPKRKIVTYRGRFHGSTKATHLGQRTPTDVMANDDVAPPT